MNTLAERFWAKVDRSGDCWLWTASTRGGYGRHWRDGKIQGAHRIAYELTHGPIPKGVGYHGTCVLHRCDVRLCVNPAHLFLGSNAENAADKSAKGRVVRLHGESNGKSKLTEAQVVEIRKAVGSQTSIAARFGVNQTLVSKIRTGRSWAHLSESSANLAHDHEWTDNVVPEFTPYDGPDAPETDDPSRVP